MAKNIICRNCEIDYHTIKNGKDIYCCNLHDMAYSDAEGFNPILCPNCDNPTQIHWRNNDNITESVVLCDNCDSEEIIKIIEEIE